MRRYGVTVAAGLALAAVGCGGQSLLCAPSACAGVKGVVKACGGPAPGRCHPQRVASVSLLDARGRSVQEMFPASGHLLSGRFFFAGLAPGHYTLETTVAGRLFKQPVTIPTGRTAKANIVVPIK